MPAAPAPSSAPPAPVADHYGPGPDGEPWLEIDWREHLRWVTLPGGPVNVLEMGDGPPLLFVHGHSGRWSNWIANIPHFARTHRVIVPDLPGFGASPMPREGQISVESYARTLDALMERLEVTAAPVVGNSLGGFVGAELAIKFPTRVERLVLVSAAGLATKYIGLPSDLLQRRSVAAFARATNAYASLPDARRATLVRRPRLRQAVLSMVVRHPNRLSAPMCMELLAGSGKPAAPDATDALVSYDYRDRVSEIACPTLIVWGEDDRTVPLSSAREYHDLIDRSRLELLPDTGHVAMLERPARFNALLEDFLADA